MEKKKDPELKNSDFKKILEKIKIQLMNNKLIQDLDITEEERQLIKNFNFLTAKPCLYVFNISESDLTKTKKEIIEESNLDYLNTEDVILVCAKMEEELNELNGIEAKNYLADLKITQTGLEQMIVAGYKRLNLISMLTTGKKDTRSWTIKKGLKAPQAAGKIHTDFEQGFARVEVVEYQNFIDNNGWIGCKEKGIARMEGKEYVIQDGDIVIFHFN